MIFDNETGRPIVSRETMPEDYVPVRDGMADIDHGEPETEPMVCSNCQRVYQEDVGVVSMVLSGFVLPVCLNCDDMGGERIDLSLQYRKQLKREGRWQSPLSSMTKLNTIGKDTEEKLLGLGRSCWERIALFWVVLCIVISVISLYVTMGIWW